MNAPNFLFEILNLIFYGTICDLCSYEGESDMTPGHLPTQICK